MYSSFKQAKEQLADINAIDFFFAKEAMVEITRLNKDLSDNSKSVLFHTLIKLMNSYSFGHACERVSDIADKTFFQTKPTEDKSKETEEVEKAGYTFPNAQTMQAMLESLNYTNMPIYYAKEFESLYINRLWLFENEIADFLKEKIATKDIDISTTKTDIAKLFPADDGDIDWQKVAVVNSMIRDFSIISGGPGTGKTTTVTKLLLALQAKNVALLAPTGKAAQRMTESIRNTTDRLKSEKLDIPDDVYESVQIEAQTIHRFLGLRPNSNHLKYYTNTKAPYDVIVVDEASMLDINIFIKLIRALDKNTKLILIGDVNQLPSVEAGSLLSSLTENSNNTFNTKTLATIKAITGYDLSQSNSYDYTVKLEKNYRSEQYINDLATKILSGSLLDTSKYDDQEHISFYLDDKSKKTYQKHLKKYADNYKEIAKQDSHIEALKQINKFRILVANRNVDIGTVKLNIELEKLINNSVDKPYKGKPIMITKNDYSSGLFNGDVGVIWPDEGGTLRAYFEYKDGYKAFSINTLPTYETVYAMTIHKTQGSEFNHVAIFLPDEMNQSLTKELLYTGVTRAKTKLDIIGSEKTLKDTIAKKITRNSNINGLLKSAKVDSANTQENS